MLKDLITSNVRVKILVLFLSHPKESFHVRDITRRVGTEINAVRRELDRLIKVGLFKREARGNRVYIRLRSDYPFLGDLLSAFDKEHGLSANILENEKGLGKVKMGLVSSEFLQGRISGLEDVDLLLVGTVDLKVLKDIVEKFQEKSGREVNYSVMGEEEFDFRKKRMDPFIVKVLTQSRIIFIGDSDKNCKL
ncbi:hypothetical protein COT49_00525 [candidate division WWE3 bacterium CG08_land_8_20_14_0_20_40_13]|uniref:HTH arsR-type domain-containing protein n=1 Tax=candidate division WWE3 bacterium CG08_land_8_20_14_0_20_40_13 TaxID=1975084 RepID=A0A2H0XEE3_UNCKA|nr:MAG: hypothetical protein COT49_00525 [candidate division WWE3 bacterium CG08_land_8_20_14_0_20_40_13]